MHTSIKGINVIYESDPAHGWLVVREIDVRKTGLTADDFSDFSYYRVIGGVTYFALEEDLDASRFATASRKAGYPLEVQERTVNRDSAIRAWPTITHLRSDIPRAG